MKQYERQQKQYKKTRTYMQKHSERFMQSLVGGSRDRRMCNFASFYFCY